MNQSCYALSPNGNFGHFFLLLATRDTVKELQTRTHGAVFSTIIIDTFKQLKIVVPKTEVAHKFEKKVEPLFDMILNLQQKIANLRTQRDLLLPKLISGELDVSEAEDVPEETAV